MKGPTLIIVLLLISGYATAAAQDSQFFKSKLGEPVNLSESSELYQQKAGITVRIDYDDYGDACSIQISAPRRETSDLQPLVSIAAALIPSSMTGAVIGTTGEVGDCTDVQYAEFEKVLMVKNNNACYGYPNVQILFKRRSCPKPLTPPALDRFFSVARSQNTCAAAPSKSRLEEMLGPPIEVYPDFRFRKNNTLVSVKFDGGYRTENLLFSGSEGIGEITRLLDQIVPQISRGKFLERKSAKVLRQHGTKYLEIYECLSIEYSKGDAQGNNAYASANVGWNK